MCSASNALQSPSLGCGGTALFDSPRCVHHPSHAPGSCSGHGERIWEFCMDAMAGFSTGRALSIPGSSQSLILAQPAHPADSATPSPGPAPFAGIFWFLKRIPCCRHTGQGNPAVLALSLVPAAWLHPWLHVSPAGARSCIHGAVPAPPFQTHSFPLGQPQPCGEQTDNLFPGVIAIKDRQCRSERPQLFLSEELLQGYEAQTEMN